MLTHGAVRFREGNKNSRNIYAVLADGTERHVGCVFEESDGPVVVAALNAAIDREKN